MSTSLVVKSAITKGVKTEAEMMIDEVIMLLKSDQYKVKRFSAGDEYGQQTTRITVSFGPENRSSLDISITQAL